MPEKINFKRGKAHSSTGFSQWSGSVICIPWGRSGAEHPGWQGRVKLTAPLLEDRKGKEERPRDRGPNISFKGTLLLAKLPSTRLVC